MLCQINFSVSQDDIPISDIPNLNDVFRGTLWVRTSTVIKKNKRLYFWQTKTRVTKRNVTSDFRIYFCYVIIHAKTAMWTECQRIWHQEGFKTKSQHHYFVEYEAISTILAVINHKSIDIQHTKRKAENILSSCSLLVLKTLFYFISQCISVP